MIKRLIYLCLFSFFLCSFSYASDLQAFKASGFVNNYSKAFPNFLNPKEIQYLEAKLYRFSQTGNGEIGIAIVDSYKGMSANQFSTELFNVWKVGKEDKDNGVLITIKPTQTEGGRSIYISTGYGAEAFVTDYKAKMIIENQLTPSFKAGRYFEGLNMATDSLISLLNNSDTDLSKTTPAAPSSTTGGLIPLILLLIIVSQFISQRNKLSNKRATLANSLLLGSTGLGRRRGGFGGGGFGGFGGGFSGGGAGGSW